MHTRRILLLIPNLDFGGAQRVFHDHALMLAEKYEVIECAFNLACAQAYPTGNQVISLDVPAGTNVLDKAFRFVQRCWRLHRLKKKEQPAITISHLEGADYVNILSFGSGKKILLVHGSKIHDQEIDHSFGWLRKKILLPWLYQRADAIVTVSEGIRHELLTYFRLPAARVHTIYNFFSLKTLQQLSQENVIMPALTPAKKVYRLISSGRFATQKNQLPLLHIVRMLKEQYQFPVQLFFAGDGPLKEQLWQACQDLQLQAQECDEVNQINVADIVFLGYQQNPFRLYAHMDLFLLPSAWEGFPMALGEAMALNIPVIAADCPTGPLELLEPDWQQCSPIQKYPRFTKNGVLLPIPKAEESKTLELWADTIYQVLQQPALMESMKKAALERMQLLDKEVIKEQWLNIERLFVESS